MTSVIRAMSDHLLDVIFPKARPEIIVSGLRGHFPMHISTLMLAGNLVTSLADYADKRVAALVHSLKYTKNSESLHILSTALGDYLLEEVSHHKSLYPGKQLVIIPMPLAKGRLQERGFNQIELLLKKVVEAHPDLTPLVQADLLIKHIDTTPQTHLNRAERLINVKGAFKTYHNIDTDVILVDDVLTTGATALEACKTLAKAGVTNVNIVTIARTL